MHTITYRPRGVCSRYMEIDRRGVEIQIREETAATGRRVPALYASIPILRMGNKGIYG